MSTLCHMGWHQTKATHTSLITYLNHLPATYYPYIYTQYVLGMYVRMYVEKNQSTRLA